MEKITQLRQILAVNPTDSFARYGLAMELAGSDDFNASLAEFATLLRDHPKYTPGYFMAAQTFARAGNPAQAKSHLRLGIESAKQTGNTHAQGEMEAMLEELELSNEA